MGDTVKNEGEEYYVLQKSEELKKQNIKPENPYEATNSTYFQRKMEVQHFIFDLICCRNNTKEIIDSFKGSSLDDCFKPSYSKIELEKIKAKSKLFASIIKFR